jgi:hypothetical protein
MREIRARLLGIIASKNQLDHILTEIAEYGNINKAILHRLLRIKDDGTICKYLFRHRCLRIGIRYRTIRSEKVSQMFVTIGKSGYDMHKLGWLYYVNIDEILNCDRDGLCGTFFSRDNVLLPSHLSSPGLRESYTSQSHLNDASIDGIFRSLAARARVLLSRIQPK